MPSNRKNNHYHYAEKFEDRRRKRPKLFLPKRTALVAALFLLIFGIVSTTFSAYVSSGAAGEDNHSIIVNVRTAKAQKDVALTGANADLAATGWSLSGPVYYVNDKAWAEPYFHIWNNGGNSDLKMTQIPGTGIYYYNGNWNDYGNFQFHDGAGTYTNKTNDYAQDACAGFFYGNSNSYNATRAQMNGTATVTAVISYDNGATYTVDYNSSSPSSNKNYATINGINLVGGNTSTSASPATYLYTYSYSDGTVTSYPAYASDYTVTAKNATHTAFLGFTTSDPRTGNAFTVVDSNTEGVTLTDSDDTHTLKKQSLQYNNSSTAADTWYACFRRYTVTDAAISPSNIAASTVKPTITYAKNGYYSVATLTAPDISGYEFDHWTFNNTYASYANNNFTQYSNPTKVVTTSGDCVATANYRLKAPTSVSLNGATYTLGGSAVSLSPNVVTDSPADGATVTISQNYTYTVVHADDTSATGHASVDSSGNFSATVPGTYKVTLSVTNTDSNNQTSDPTVSSEVTVIAYPQKLSWTMTMSGFDENGSANNGYEYGSEGNPYLVNLGGSFSFSGALTGASSDSQYEYRWHDGSNIYITSGDPSGAMKSALATEDAAATKVELYCKIVYKDPHDSNNELTTDTDHLSKWYYIKSPIESFKIPNMQKIYSTQQTVSMEVKYTISNLAGYTTKLFQSTNNVDFYEVESATGHLLGNDATTTVTPSQAYTFDETSRMVVAGPKYFYLNISKAVGSTTANAKTDVVHTTVGAAQTAANRPIYFIDSSGLDLSSYRVMAFYLDGNGDVKYQTAQDVFKMSKDTADNALNKRFRVSIPSDATRLAFAVANANRYAVPSWNSEADNFDFTMGITESGKENTYFIAYTPAVTLSTGFNTIKATSKTLVSGYSEDPDSPNLFYTYTVSTGSYQTTGATG